MSVFVRKVIYVSVCNHCLVLNNRLSVPRLEGGVPETWLTPCDWLAPPL